MGQPVMQPAFSAGELAPSLYARVDLAKYHIGAKLLRNMFVHTHGGASNRPGTQYITRCKGGGTGQVRLIPFQFSTEQTYILEFGDQYMRVIKDGGVVLETAQNISGITKANPAVVTYAGADNYANGDWVYITGVVGMTEVNGKFFKVAGVNTGSNTFQLTDLDGNNVDSSNYATYTSGGTVSEVYTMTTPYAAADLALLKFTQSADVMTLTHPSYAPRDLTRSGHASWTLTSITFAPSISAPSGVAATPAVGAAGTTYRYVVTAVTEDGRESTASSAASTTVAATMSSTAAERITVDGWGAVSGAASYNVYRQREVPGGAPSTGSAYGYVGTTTTTSFVDANIVPDFTVTPPQAKNPFTSNNHPGVVSYFEQRKIFGGSDDNPQSIWMTRPGDYANMDTSDPSQGSDAITVTIAAQQVNRIKHFVPLNSLIVLTTGGAWKLSSGLNSDTLTPTSTVVSPQAYSGASDVPPLVINTDILYVQARGSTVRNLALNQYTDSYSGTDMSVLSNHLFFGREILEWCYAEEPFKLAYAVRDDGKILMFTYLKEQDVYAWTWGESPGDSEEDEFKSVASVGEGDEDAVYFVVERTLPGVNGGNAVQYIERLHSRNFLTDGEADVTKCWFLDCAAEYVGAATDTVSGLEYLEGATVSVFADGNVLPSVEVEDGSITIQQAASRIVVGLPYSATLRTLNPDVGTPTIQGKRKTVNAVTLRVENTRGLKVGPTEETLRPIKERSTQPYNEPIPLTTGDQRITIDPVYNTEGSIYAQQDDPLPCTILGVIPELTVGH